jgi:hypothetical protein
MGALLLSAGAKDPVADGQGFCARHCAIKGCHNSLSPLCVFLCNNVITCDE